MNGPGRAGYVRGLLVWSAWAGVAFFVGAVVLDGGAGPLAAGVAIGAAGSFAILALRIKSVSKVLAAGAGREATRSAFFYSLAKMACAFGALCLGGLLGLWGAVGALVGLFVTTVAAVGEGIASARRQRQ